MTIETDEDALKRFGIKPADPIDQALLDSNAVMQAINENGRNNNTCSLWTEYYCDSDRHSGDEKWTPHSILFCYMRVDTDGKFYSKNYEYHSSDPIPDDGDFSKKGTLGFYIQDMAKYARPYNYRTHHSYKENRSNIDDIDFINKYSYCVFFMDDVHWEFLMAGTEPVIKFHKIKHNKPYANPKHTFTIAQRLEIDMPNRRTGIEDARECAVMINRMHNSSGGLATGKDDEKFSFDLVMRVRYARSGKRLTVLIDPGGDNPGPPAMPPDLS